MLLLNCTWISLVPLKVGALKEVPARQATESSNPAPSFHGLPRYFQEARKQDIKAIALLLSVVVFISPQHLGVRYRASGLGGSI